MSPGHPAAPLARRLTSFLTLLLALALPGWPAFSRAQTADAGLGLPETLVGILAYTRWPVTPRPLRLCVMGSSPHGDRLLREGLTWAGPRPVVVLSPWQQAPIADQCDALYIGAFDALHWSSLLPGLEGRAVLTVCERSDACAAAGMVRLHIDPTLRRVRFAVNLDAVARSTVRIHPQVLKLGRRDASRAAP